MSTFQNLSLSIFIYTGLRLEHSIIAMLDDSTEYVVGIVRGEYCSHAFGQQIPRSVDLVPIACEHVSVPCEGALLES
eukprot:scaffold5169_cov172-Amphora_coffeaeformis.AAC.36